jgi:AraC-like DNA-binding protein
MADIIRAGSLWGFSQLTRSLGHDPRPLLAEAGLCEGDLDDPDRFIPRAAVANLLEVSATRLECSDFGLRLAGQQDINVLGALAFAVRHAPDFHSALKVGVRHLQYHSSQMTMALEHGDSPGQERVTFQRVDPDQTHYPQISEQTIGLFCRIDRELTGDRYRPLRVTFAHEPLSSSDVYAEHLGLVPEFGAERTSIYLDQRELSFRMLAANPQLQAIVERYIKLTMPRTGAPTVPRATRAISEIMRHGAASVDDVAEMLHMHPRTLQRRLTEERTTFEKLRDHVRKEMARTHLANHLVPLAEVAHLLSYANQSALTRSCLRWFGKTPRQVRQQSAGPGR